MANIVTPSVSNLYYTVVDTLNNNVRTSIKLIAPGTSLIDNSDGIASIDGVVHGNEVSTFNYIVNASVDINGYTIPGWESSDNGAESYEDKSSVQLDYILIVYRDYFLINTPSADYELDLRDTALEPNEPLNDGDNNQYLLDIQDVFINAEYVFTVLTNPE